MPRHKYGLTVITSSAVGDDNGRDTRRTYIEELNLDTRTLRSSSRIERQTSAKDCFCGSKCNFDTSGILNSAPGGGGGETAAERTRVISSYG